MSVRSFVSPNGNKLSNYIRGMTSDCNGSYEHHEDDHSGICHVQLLLELLVEGPLEDARPGNRVRPTRLDSKAGFSVPNRYDMIIDR